MSEINITPLVDVMLVLVVIFIITAPLLASSIRLDLPQHGCRQAQRRAQVRHRGPRHGRAGLPERKAGDPGPAGRSGWPRPRRDNPETEIQLRADQAVPYGRVVEVMGAAQKAGLNRIGFVAESPPAAAVKPARKIDRRPGLLPGTLIYAREIQPCRGRALGPGALDRERRLSRDRRRQQEEVLRLLDAALPERQAAHGPCAQLHHQRHAHALPAHERLQRADAHGLGRLRPAGGERGDEERRAAGQVDLRQHRLHEAADAGDGPGHRLEPRGRDLRSRATTSGTSGCSSRCWKRASPTARPRS